MAKTKSASNQNVSKRFRPALTPESRENQMIALAVDQAERQLREGTASPSVIVHYLKLGTTKMQLEKDILVEQRKLIQAKTAAIESTATLEAALNQAMEAMKKYQGTAEEYDDADLL